MAQTTGSKQYFAVKLPYYKTTDGKVACAVRIEGQYMPCMFLRENNMHNYCVFGLHIEVVRDKEGLGHIRPHRDCIFNKLQ